jgi:hypothetical protein
MGTAETPDLQWVYSAVVPAGMANAEDKMVCLVPVIVNGDADWAVVALTGDVLSDMGVAAKDGDVAVAQLVEAEKAAEMVLSAMSEPATGGAIDNIAPSALVSWAADDNEGADAGVMVTWEAPEDHGIVGYYGWAGVGQYPIYGVTEYQVMRAEQGSTDYVLVGSAAPMSTSFVDPVEDSATIYDYMVKAVDSAHEVETGVLSAMAFAGGADFNSDASVGLGDLVLLGNQWGMTSTDVGWVSAFDLNTDNSIGLGDLVLLGNAWTTAGKVAKALPVTSDVAVSMDANYDETSSTYYVNVNVSEAEGFNGIGFTLSYDTEALELVNESIVGLGSVNITKQLEEGMLDVNSYFMEDEFNGSITIGFKSRGMNEDLDFELVNAGVSIDNVISAVSDVEKLTVKAVPAAYSLAQNYPNPFNPTTTIEYSIPQSGHVELSIWNLAGQKVRTLVNNQQTASYQKVVWDGRNDMGEKVGSGLYFYKLVSGNFSKIQKMQLIK